MLTRLSVFSVCFAFVFLWTHPADTAPIRPDKKDKEIRTLVKRLGLPDAQAVDEAVKTLTSHGPAALPALRDAAAGDDKKVATRAKEVISAIAANAHKQVTEQLAKLKGNGAKVNRASDTVLEKVFPGHLFFPVVFQQFPIARQPPAPLKMQNVFVIGPDKTLKLIGDVKGLLEFFGTDLAPVKDDTAVKDVTRAWLALGITFHQDGFFHFTIPTADGVTVTKEAKGKEATAQAEVVKQGGNSGEVKARLVFKADGTLSTVNQTATLRAGIRPICQATKLLDPDPVVRRMAEKDILVMGRAARAYLQEQRAKAKPELQKAIDRVWKRILDEGW